MERDRLPGPGARCNQERCCALGRQLGSVSAHRREGSCSTGQSTGIAGERSQRAVHGPASGLLDVFVIGPGAACISSSGRHQ